MPRNPALSPNPCVLHLFSPWGEKAAKTFVQGIVRHLLETTKDPLLKFVRHTIRPADIESDPRGAVTTASHTEISLMEFDGTDIQWPDVLLFFTTLLRQLTEYPTVTACLFVQGNCIEA